MNITDAKKIGIKIPKDIVLTKEEWKDLYVTLADFKSRVMSRRKDAPEPAEKGPWCKDCSLHGEWEE